MDRRSFLRAVAVVATCSACARLARAESAHWSYAGASGPTKWGALGHADAVCATGTRQSPLDIEQPVKASLSPLKLDYQRTVAEIVNNGHTIQVNMPPGSTMENGAETHDLLQFHFHRPSEHLIEGYASAMEVHFVHRAKAGGLAVVGVLLGVGAENPTFAAITRLMPAKPGSVKTGLAEIDPNALLPPGRGYYRYAGSLTTPPCSEDVDWYVLTEPMPLSSQHIAAFARLYPMNARPAQKGFKRFVLVSG